MEGAHCSSASGLSPGRVFLNYCFSFELPTVSHLLNRGTYSSVQADRLSALAFRMFKREFRTFCPQDQKDVSFFPLESLNYYLLVWINYFSLKKKSIVNEEELRYRRVSLFLN